MRRGRLKAGLSVFACAIPRQDDERTTRTRKRPRSTTAISRTPWLLLALGYRACSPCVQNTNLNPRAHLASRIGYRAVSERPSPCAPKGEGEPDWLRASSGTSNGEANQSRRLQGRRAMTEPNASRQNRTTVSIGSSLRNASLRDRRNSPESLSKRAPRMAGRFGGSPSTKG